MLLPIDVPRYRAVVLSLSCVVSPAPPKCTTLTQRNFAIVLLVSCRYPADIFRCPSVISYVSRRCPTISHGTMLVFGNYSFLVFPCCRCFISVIVMSSNSFVPVVPPASGVIALLLRRRPYVTLYYPMPSCHRFAAILRFLRFIHALCHVTHA